MYGLSHGLPPCAGRHAAPACCLHLAAGHSGLHRSRLRNPLRACSHTQRSSRTTDAGAHVALQAAIAAPRRKLSVRRATIETRAPLAAANGLKRGSHSFSELADIFGAEAREQWLHPMQVTLPQALSDPSCVLNDMRWTAVSRLT